MPRLIFVPQYPTPMRYQSWYFSEFPHHLKKYFDSVYIVGEKYLGYKRENSSDKMFSPIKAAIDFENQQVLEFMNMELYENDILLQMDISFPGFFNNVLYHKRPSKCFSFCHATSKNRLDYFKNIRHSKWKCESAHSTLFDKIFVASNYHLNKLRWKNIEVLHSLPNPPFKAEKSSKKFFNIISLSRPTSQKVTLHIEKEVEKEFNTEIIRRRFFKWNDYFRFISSSKIVLITAKEDTYGYQIIDAVINNTIPLAPNQNSYPEILPKEYLYDSIDDLKEKIRNVFNGKYNIPKLVNQKYINEFYENLAKKMLSKS